MSNYDVDYKLLVESSSSSIVKKVKVVVKYDYLFKIK